LFNIIAPAFSLHVFVYFLLTIVTNKTTTFHFSNLMNNLTNPFNRERVMLSFHLIRERVPGTSINMSYYINFASFRILYLSKVRLLGTSCPMVSVYPDLFT